MSELVEISQPSEAVGDITEKLQIYRGNLLRGVAAIRQGGGRMLMAFVNQGSDEDFDAIITTGRHIADVCEEGLLDEYDPEQLAHYRLYEVKNFGESELVKVMDQAQKDTQGVKGTLNQRSMGLIDVTTQGVLTLGRVDLAKNEISLARIDERTI